MQSGPIWMALTWVTSSLLQSFSSRISSIKSFWVELIRKTWFWTEVKDNGPNPFTLCSHHRVSFPVQRGFYRISMGCKIRQSKILNSWSFHYFRLMRVATERSAARFVETTESKTQHAPSAGNAHGPQSTVTATCSMNDVAVFIYESHRKLNLWEPRSQDTDVFLLLKRQGGGPEM